MKLTSRTAEPRAVKTAGSRRPSPIDHIAETTTRRSVIERGLLMDERFVAIGIVRDVDELAIPFVAVR